MKVFNINSYLPFGSTLLYKAKIRQHLHDCPETTPCDVYITRLDKSDLSRLKRDEKDWEDTKYGPIIIDSLDNQRPEEDLRADMAKTFYAIETPNPFGERQIRALAQTTNYIKEKKLELDWLQTNNRLSMPNYLEGAGSCLMFVILKNAKKCNANMFSVYSNNKALDFYKKFGLKRSEEEYNEFTLEKRLFDRKADNIRKKYSIEPAGFVK